MDRNPKRARKKEVRDQRVLAMQAAFRRRRAARIAGVVVTIAAVVGLMLYATGRDDGNGPDADAGGTPSPAPTASPTAEPSPTAAACGGKSIPDPNPKTNYKGAPSPEQVLEEGVDYRAVVETSCGTFEMDLLEKSSPRTAANFVFLAREGYFDGLHWHRVERNFVIQTGDPNNINGEPPDDPGYSFDDELTGATAEDYVFGTVAMANRGPNTNGSQWFIVVHAPPEPAGLDPLYSIFGRVPRSDFDVLETIASQDVRGGSGSDASVPVDPIVIISIEIEEA